MTNYDDFMKLAVGRRSCRNFLPDEIPEDKVGKVIEAGRWVPSAHNWQTTLTIRILDRNLKNILIEQTKKMMDCSFDPFYGAPEILMVIGNDKSMDLSLLNGALVMENMMLAAHALGLGSCWINTAQYNSDFVKLVMKEIYGRGELPYDEWIKISANCMGIGYLALGVPSKEYFETTEHPLPRKKNTVFCV